MSRQEVKLQDIDASLTHGQIFSSNGWKWTIRLMYISVGIVGAIIIVLLIGELLTMREYDSNIIVAIISMSIGTLALTGTTVIVQLYINSGKKKARLWLEDAVILEANAESKDTELQWRNVFLIASAIKVTFVYKGKRYVRQSLYKGKPLHLITFNKYVGKRILIAYSPKYDEVMLIRPRSAKAIKENIKK